MRLLALVLIGLVLAASAATAQTLEIGDRVRVSAPTLSSDAIIGRIARADSFRITVIVTEATRMAPAEERTIDLRTVTLIERSEGYKSKVKTGAVIGGLAGVATGVFLGWAAAMSESDSRHLITGPIVFGGMGAVGGAAIGAAFSSERWTALPVDARVGFQLGTGSTPLAVGIHTRF
jgi:hypothetical protein